MEGRGGEDTCLELLVGVGEVLEKSLGVGHSVGGERGALLGVECWSRFGGLWGCRAGGEVM